MARLSDILGLTLQDTVYLFGFMTGYLIVLIPFCCFFGYLIYDAYDSIVCSLGLLIAKAYAKIRKHFSERSEK